MADPIAVLLVDDIRDVREGLARVLRRSGYSVDTAENGLEALADVEKRQFRVVISDIMMPVMDGVRFYEILERRHPLVARRVIFVSAWSDDPEVQAFLRAAGRPLLQKPFEIQDLLRAVEGVAA